MDRVHNFYLLILHIISVSPISFRLQLKNILHMAGDE